MLGWPRRASLEGRVTRYPEGHGFDLDPPAALRADADRDGHAVPRDGALDTRCRRRASRSELVDLGNDGLVLNGTTGESPTTTDEEKDRLVRAVLEAVGDRAHVVAGVGTNDTAHTIELARAAEKAGAHGLLVVTPYYNKPPQDGSARALHRRRRRDRPAGDALRHPRPHRRVAISTESLLRLAEHPQIVANKDAKGDLFGAQQVMSRCELVYYSGDDALNLPLRRRRCRRRRQRDRPPGGRPDRRDDAGARGRRRRARARAQRRARARSPRRS